MDIRYLDMHRLENVEMVYCISILENFSPAVLASAISLRQDTEAFFAVFYTVVRKYGIPEVLVSDNGSVFTSHDTRRVCEQLGIEKKEVKIRNFLLYGKQGLAGKKTLVNIFQDILTAVFSA